MEISTETLIFLVLRSSDLDDRNSAPSPEFTDEIVAGCGQISSVDL